MSDVDYSHEINRDLHTVDGARAALGTIFPTTMPTSLLDVGCGTGTWLRAAMERGVDDIQGADGWYGKPELFYIPEGKIRRTDLNQPIDFERKFDLVICLEVAEHIEPENVETLVDTLARHGDRILFSAAAPDQAGTHHVNCQWPDYWQRLFNARGFACDDSVRWAIWDDERVEGWYRQNILMANRDADRAGHEPRIKPVIHPAALDSFGGRFLPSHLELIERGGMRWPWYVGLPMKAGLAKLRGRLGQAR